MLVVEQNANLALEIANRAYVLEAGVIALSGSADQLRNDDGTQGVPSTRGESVAKAEVGCDEHPGVRLGRSFAGPPSSDDRNAACRSRPGRARRRAVRHLGIAMDGIKLYWIRFLDALANGFIYGAVALWRWC